MARSDTSPALPPPRLYLLISPAAGEATRLAETVRAAAGAADIAAVLLRPDPQAGSAELRALVATCQESGAACLIDGNTALALAVGADGVHVGNPASLKAALAAMRPDGIVGAGGLKTRHDAMSAGEGADYVMFGEPDAEGRRAPFDTTRERVEWWAEIFEAPCVGYARTLEEVDVLVAAHADFIAVDNLILDDPAEGAKVLMARLSLAEAG